MNRRFAILSPSCRAARASPLEAASASTPGGGCGSNREALARLPENSTYFLTAVGGKTLYTNQPVTPDGPSLSELCERGGSAKPAVPASSTGDDPPHALQKSS